MDRAAVSQPGIAAVVLAAGCSRRMGGANKLLLPINGEPLIRRVVLTVASAPVAAVFVVIGHQQAPIRAALAGIAVDFVVNPDYARGMASSVRAGIAACDGYDGALVCLADMPWIRTETLARLVGAHRSGRIVLPTGNGRRGHPVLWDRSFFADFDVLEGDVGARALLDRYQTRIVAIETDDEGIWADVDTPDAAKALNLNNI